MSERELLLAAARRGWVRPMTAEIARAAGVSESSVRAVFRDPHAAVSETRRRVMRALSMLDGIGDPEEPTDGRG